MLSISSQCCSRKNCWKEKYYKCSNLASITIPSSVTSIGSEAFSCCYSFTSITIPNSVKSIQYSTFRGCTGLTSITIPESVTSIGKGVFKECSELSNVYCLAETVPNTDSEAFEDFDLQHKTLYVPAKALSDYRTTLPWCNFGTIKALEEGHGDR